MDSGRSHHHRDAAAILEAKQRKSNILVFSDGGLRKNGLAAAAWVAFTNHGTNVSLLAYDGILLEDVTSAFKAEVIALDRAVEFVSSSLGTEQLQNCA